MAAARYPKRFGPYDLLKPLGQGGTGTVHLARPVDARRGVPSPVVIKRLHPALADREDFLRRFRHEGMIAVRVDHPSLAKVYDVGAVGDMLYLASEYVEGWQLADVLQAFLDAAKLMPYVAVIEVVMDVLDGLDALHRATDPITGAPLGVVHRDVTPRNVLITENATARLIDLGLGKSKLQDWKTRTGTVMGTLGYMAPEQAIGQKVDHRSDLYAVATVLHEMLVLRPYVPRGERPAMIRAMENPVFRKPSMLRPELPTALDGILEKALAREPDDRFSSALELKDALGTLLPPTSDRPQFAKVLNHLLGAELERSRADVQSLLQLEPVEVNLPEEPTEVYAQRTGIDTFEEVRTDVSDARGGSETNATVRAAVPSSRRAATVRADDSLPDITVPVAAAVAGPTPTPLVIDEKALVSVHDTDAGPTAVAPDPSIAPKGTSGGPQTGPQPAARARGVPISVVVLLVGAAVVATVVADRVLLGPREQQAPVTREVTGAVPEPAAATAAPRPMATERPQENADAVEPPRAHDEVVTAPSRERSRARPRPPAKELGPRDQPAATPPPPGSERAPAATAEAVTAALVRLTTLSKEKRRTHPERASEVDEIVVDATMWARNQDRARALLALDRLTRRLEKMD